MKSLRVVLLLTALSASVATSAVYDVVPFIEASTVLHNASDGMLIVQVAHPTVEPDCLLLATHPRLLDELDWREPFSASVGPRENLDLFAGTGCPVARVTLPGSSTRVVAAMNEPLRTFPVSWARPEDIPAGVVAVMPTEAMPWRPTSADLLHEVGEPLGTCEAPLGELDWRVVHDGPGRVLDIAKRGDCTRLALDTARGPSTAEICGTDIAPGFLPGDAVTVTHTDLQLQIEGAGDAPTFVATRTGQTLPGGLYVGPDDGSDVHCMDHEADCKAVALDGVLAGDLAGELTRVPVGGTVVLELPAAVVELEVHDTVASLQGCYDRTALVAQLW